MAALAWWRLPLPLAPPAAQTARVPAGACLSPGLWRPPYWACLRAGQKRSSVSSPDYPVGPSAKARCCGPHVPRDGP